MVFAVVVPLTCFVLLGTVSLALPVDSPALFVLRVLRDARSTCHVAALVFAACFFLFLLILMLALYEIRGINLPNLPDVSH